MWQTVCNFLCTNNSKLHEVLIQYKQQRTIILLDQLICRYREINWNKSILSKVCDFYDVIEDINYSEVLLALSLLKWFKLYVEYREIKAPNSSFNLASVVISNTYVKFSRQTSLLVHLTVEERGGRTADLIINFLTQYLKKPIDTLLKRYLQSRVKVCFKCDERRVNKLMMHTIFHDFRID